ncbi:acyl-ACP thioesterase [Desulfosarcina variabilis str. Montpellier]|uniref:acyl-[acyl-carrier-protein] thioesterase n=1 Tax=Desulfosarcina variabilis TaxID=2300 RepID=UPI003AFB16A5
MKIKQTTTVQYDDVDTDFRMKLPVLFQRLQRAALHHSESVGLSNEKMVADGAVWILNRMLVRIQRLPVYREPLTVRTWHKGSVGFRAGRDYQLFCNQEQVAAATSQWLFFDLNKKRITKIPKAVSAPYTAEAEEVLGAGAIDFAVDKAAPLKETMTITTRAGDLDPNGHVNNAAYLDYLDTLIKRSSMPSGMVTQVGIQYFKEIGQDVHDIQAGLTHQTDTAHFRFYDSSAVYAAGFVTFGVPLG